MVPGFQLVRVEASTAAVTTKKRGINEDTFIVKHWNDTDKYIR